MDQPMSYRTVVADGLPGLDERLSAELDRVNATATVGVAPARELTVQILDAAGELAAGMSGWTWGVAAGIGMTWVRDGARGEGLGARLLTSFEDEARARGCTHVFVTSFTFQAPGFYERHGYREIFRWEGVPTPDSADVHFRKDLSAASPRDQPEPVLADGYEVRALTSADAPALAAAYRRNRDHLARWDPVRPASFFTDESQAIEVQDRLEVVRRGLGASWVLVHGDEVVGRINLNNIVRGVFQSASVGYWTDAAHTGRGLATAMVEHAVEQAAAEGLHRLEAGTLVDNLASQAVLRRAGFSQFGAAADYLFIAGEWQDHLLFQRILHDRPAGNPVP